jgi:aerobic-type carbon monoxide dehydrogenase small subunit (CoxS/CutS family)
VNHDIDLNVNGERYRLSVPSHWTLLRVIREQLALTGTKNGCEAGECGACTVLMNGQPVNSCMVLAPEADGADIVTIEGLSEEGRLAPIQEAFVETGSIQCGFCTPGALIAAHALLARNAYPSEDEIREALVGNLCRCTGYGRMVKAIQLVALRAAEANFVKDVAP